MTREQMEKDVRAFAAPRDEILWYSVIGGVHFADIRCKSGPQYGLQRIVASGPTRMQALRKLHAHIRTAAIAFLSSEYDFTQPRAHREPGGDRTASCGSKRGTGGVWLRCMRPSATVQR